eukprot:TRINITY_DN15109_c0_g1_i1.p1 TRINITY_DN15109_c0_g1~~TRINITY_DN15109_c0_g1_i1.p1  ORF type:complete len:110 (+),score=18.93 TRINITY_DN15109_c0_g1_i1:260-589(+)
MSSENSPIKELYHKVPEYMRPGWHWFTKEEMYKPLTVVGTIGVNATAFYGIYCMVYQKNTISKDTHLLQPKFLMKVFSVFGVFGAVLLYGTKLRVDKERSRLAKIQQIQ